MHDSPVQCPAVWLLWVSLGQANRLDLLVLLLVLLLPRRVFR
jgi:hypothetical protein